MVRRAIAALAIVLCLATAVRCTDNCAMTGTSAATTTPTVTQGPYHITETPELFRSNVTEGQAGVPLDLQITVLDMSCETVVGAFVEIWHANATGYYSGVIGQTPDIGEAAGGASNEYTTFLRGVVMTDSTGVAEFQTNLPGVYLGRAMHVHYAVHIPRNASLTEEEEWDGSYVTLVGQVFFHDTIADLARTYYPYSLVSDQSITYLASDNVYTGDINTLADITPVAGDFGEGVTGLIQAIIDPTQVTSLLGGDYVTGTNLTSSSSSTGGGLGGEGMAQAPTPQSQQGAGAMSGTAQGPAGTGGMGGPAIPSGNGGAGSGGAGAPGPGGNTAQGGGSSGSGTVSGTTSTVTTVQAASLSAAGRRLLR